MRTWVAAGLFAGVVVFAGDAGACGFGSYGAEDDAPKVIVIPPPERVANADRELDRGHAASAAAEVVRAFPRARHLAGSVVPLEARAARILALAIARTAGAPGVSGFDGSTPAARGENLAWAAKVLRQRLVARNDDPVAQADLAEALEHAPGGRTEALAILRPLAERDLLGSPFAYASLARMQLAAGDARGAAEALARCRTMTRTPGAVCPSLAGQALASR